MTPQEEEKYLVDQLADANAALHMANNEAKIAKVAYDKAKAYADSRKEIAKEHEQALIDYMQGNGITQMEDEFSTYSFRKSRSVNIVDEEAVPSKYIRTKKEVNKALIRAESLDPRDNNWLTYDENVSLIIKPRS